MLFIENMKEKFDREEAKKFLFQKQEKERIALLQTDISFLEKELKGSSVEVYLVESLLGPYSFTANLDVDMVLKSYKGHRFELSAKLKSQIGRKVEIIPYEKIQFQEFVLIHGLKVM